MRKILTLIITGAALAVALPACGSQEDCIVLANGGNKLCGEEAKAWCSSTDSIRNVGQTAADDSTFGDQGISDSISESQAMCDQIRGR